MNANNSSAQPGGKAGQKGQEMKYVAVERINNPKSENNGKWYVCVSDKLYEPMKTVFINKSKKACVEYAKKLKGNLAIGNGIEYGAKF